MDEPIWIERGLIEALHQDQVRTYGGRFGLRDANLLESALARPRQKWAYEPQAGVHALAAAYAFGIAKNHPFVDGNKRTAFAAMTLFLARNGYPLVVSEADAIVTMLAVAAGDRTEDDLAAWCRAHARPR